MQLSSSFWHIWGCNYSQRSHPKEEKGQSLRAAFRFQIDYDNLINDKLPMSRTILFLGRRRVTFHQNEVQLFTLRSSAPPKNYYKCSKKYRKKWEIQSYFKFKSQYHFSFLSNIFNYSYELSNVYNTFRFLFVCLLIL